MRRSILFLLAIMLSGSLSFFAILIPFYGFKLALVLAMFCFSLTVLSLFFPKAREFTPTVFITVIVIAFAGLILRFSGESIINTVLEINIVRAFVGFGRAGVNVKAAGLDMESMGERLVLVQIGTKMFLNSDLDPSATKIVKYDIVGLLTNKSTSKDGVVIAWEVILPEDYADISAGKEKKPRAYLHGHKVWIEASHLKPYKEVLAQKATEEAEERARVKEAQKAAEEAKVKADKVAQKAAEEAKIKADKVAQKAAEAKAAKEAKAKAEAEVNEKATADVIVVTEKDLQFSRPGVWVINPTLMAKIPPGRFRVLLEKIETSPQSVGYSLGIAGREVLLKNVLASNPVILCPIIEISTGAEAWFQLYDRNGVINTLVLRFEKL